MEGNPGWIRSKKTQSWIWTSLLLEFAGGINSLQHTSFYIISALLFGSLSLSPTSGIKMAFPSCSSSWQFSVGLPRKLKPSSLSLWKHNRGAKSPGLVFLINVYKRTPLGLSVFLTICFKGLWVSILPPSWSLPHPPVCCVGNEKLPDQSAFWLSEWPFFFFPLFWQLQFFAFQGHYGDTRHPLRNSGQYSLFPQGNNSRDGRSVKWIWVKVTVPWAGGLACLGERGEGSLCNQKSLCDSELTLARIQKPFFKLLQAVWEHVSTYLRPIWVSTLENEQTVERVWNFHPGREKLPTSPTSPSGSASASVKSRRTDSGWSMSSCWLQSPVTLSPLIRYGLNSNLFFKSLKQLGP